ncbi:MAG: hypothetical protein ACKN9E_18685 [Microcystaceae cyanobacterium]
MDNHVLDNVKFLLQAVGKLSEQILTLEAKVRQLEENRPAVNAIDVNSYQYTLTQDNEYTFDLPLSRLLQVYGETPQVLEPACYRGAMVLDYQGDRPILERNPQGNYWIFKLKQDYLLLPRPGAFGRMAALESLTALFQTTGRTSEFSPSEFVVKEPAKLDLLKRQERWQLVTKGNLEFGLAPLEFQWQQEIQSLRQDYQQFNQLLKTVGEAGLEATINIQRWQQELASQYGPPVSLIINTCMPMAYAIYKGPMLVPCNVITAKQCLVLPAWDRGIPWETSIYAKFHSKHNKNVLRSRPDHPFLPNQPYLKEINWETNHTWAIASSYEDASRIVTCLKGNWGALD